MPEAAPARLDVLDGALRIVVDLEHHACAVVVDPVKGHRARVPCAAAARPRDALVGALLDDLGLPFLFLAADDRAPVQALVVELMNFLHALHEARKLLELRPLVVDRPKRCIDLDGLLDSRHDEPLLNIRSGWKWGRNFGATEHRWRDAARTNGGRARAGIVPATRASRRCSTRARRAPSRRRRRPVARRTWRAGPGRARRERC